MWKLQDLTRKWGEVRQLVPQRDATLQAELRKQQSKFKKLEMLNLYLCPTLGAKLSV